MHQTLCICGELPVLQTRTRLYLLMHREEEMKTTNTGRLAVFCLPGSEILVHGERERPAVCPPLSGWRPLVLLHDDEAELLTPEHGQGEPVALFVPDGTWRQASKMRRRLPWLAEMPSVSLPPGPPTAYSLRSESKPGGLGTLEAIARAMGLLEGPAIQDALEHVFRLMVERTLYSRGLLPREAVFGGVPSAHTPLAAPGVQCEPEQVGEAAAGPPHGRTEEDSR
jgi:DTW domain-containing protein